VAGALRELHAAPADPVSYCVHCHRWLDPPRRFYCDERCKRRAYRRLRAKQPMDAYPKGAQRGRVSLGEKTQRERLDDLLEARPRPELSERDLRRFG